ncbi:L,D-transpeptidase family protein [Chitinophaga qingshengii]|uniref:L,D-transpeptidase family protein n=1 Tax=Chitinophaga qingshengii TaxID=1569794 RepID=A0ABR7TPH6_9BACT|nr:L,D-transpeptidase family protein [Chitinophaga qingshengii]MBC9932371.1 L,D-transpeptidase family protein [Chitinophaga qingshengii]
MRYLFLLTLLAYLISGCNTPSSPDKTEVVTAEVITPRNTAITHENAYNDLFLDSVALSGFIAKRQLNDSVANRLRSFYNARNYQFAWIDSRGLTEEAAAFRSLFNQSTDTAGDKPLNNKLDRLLEEDSMQVKASDPDMIQTELMLTWRLVRYFRQNGGTVEQMEHMVPMQKQDMMVTADSMLHTSEQQYPAVAALKPALRQYRDIVKKGGWASVDSSVKSLKKGQSSPVIIAIKNRLAITGELREKDSSALFTDELETAINKFRNGHGYTENGVINDTVIQAMNVPAVERLKQLLINMQRMKWLPATPKGKLIVVNIPAFMLHVTDNGKKVFDMPIVVGKEGHSTTMFSGKLNQVVFSPYWNIPRSIVRKEILPAMSRNSGYLARKNMEITGHVNGLPVIRQRPGAHNALGRVKFLFPNSFNIYFHDTPEKRLFSRDNRAYSHGCIRLKDPVEMARFVLEDSPQWTDEKIDEAMNAGKQKYVAVKHPVPVIITYFTAWGDEDGTLHLVPDVYGHDAVMKQKMF